MLGRPDLAGLVLVEAARRGSSGGGGGGGGGGGWALKKAAASSKQQATQAAHRLCLASTACRQAVLGTLERAAAPGEWALKHAAALAAVTALVSLRLTGDQGVDPARLPPLLRLTSLECSLTWGADAAAAWPGLSGLRQLDLEVACRGLPPALLQLRTSRASRRGPAPGTRCGSSSSSRASGCWTSRAKTRTREASSTWS